MLEMTALRLWKGLLAAFLATSLMVVAAMGAAEARPMHGQDPENTRQSTAQGPSDPGLKWFTDVSALDGFTVDSWVDRSGGSTNNAPLVTADGTVIIRASNDDGGASLVALAGEDGTLAWTIDDIVRRCAAAMDSSGNLWTVLTADAEEDRDDPALQAFDPATGTQIAGARVVLEDISGRPCQNSSVHIGGSPETAVLFDWRSAPNITAIDISTPTTPSLAWTLNEETAPVDTIARSGTQARIAAFADDTLLLPAVTDDELELVGLSLSDGEVIDRVALPVLDADGEDTGDLNRLDTAHLLVSGDQVIAGIRRGTGGRTGTVVRVDLSTWNTTILQTIEPRTSTAGSGPTQMALSGNDVVYNSGWSRLYGNDVTTGEPTSWSGELAVRELGGGLRFDVVTDSAGNIYTAVRDGAVRLVRFDPTGETDWRVPESALQAETGTPPGANVRLAGITQAGDLVAYGQNSATFGQIYVIDGSGGLAEEEQCVLPFTDVRETSVHAVNICRLVERGITSGVAEDRYNPRGDVTRAQMASFLARALELPAGSGDQFPDVDPNNVHAENILAIRDAGITLGRADGTYDPGGDVTRAEMASFLARAAGLDGVAGTGFTDVDPDNVHAPNIYALRDAEITGGVTATSYDPDGPVRRDQMASFLIRMLDFLDEQG